MKEIDERGEWEVSKGKACNIRLLIKPSQSFLDEQAAIPTYEPKPVRDLLTELDELKAKLKEKGIL
ncbi:unnamed protein product [marine sediment metagenome]|uniref:Uncharacterized protein n=1 Tax=marine sediment metagenome TaxID=412755 RepID=X1SRB3_9ZZZZ